MAEPKFFVYTCILFGNLLEDMPRLRRNIREIRLSSAKKLGTRPKFIRYVAVRENKLWFGFYHYEFLLAQITPKKVSPEVEHA